MNNDTIFALMCARKVCNDLRFTQWADQLLGGDMSYLSNAREIAEHLQIECNRAEDWVVLAAHEEKYPGELDKAKVLYYALSSAYNAAEAIHDNGNVWNTHKAWVKSARSFMALNTKF